MDKKDFWCIVIISLVIAVVVFFIMGQITGQATSGGQAQCRDRIDNDGDNKTDYPADSGCSSKNDNGEASCVSGSTTCGMGACWRQSTCVNDAVSCISGTPSTEICDGVDNDCDGLLNEGGVCGNQTNQTG